MISSRLCYHGESYPVSTEDLYLPGSHVVAYQDVKAQVYFQGILRLLEVQEYIVEDRLPLVRELL